MLNNVVKESRIKQNLKQEDVAEFVGVTVQTYSKWENGKTEPKASQVVKLSKILKISEKEICRGEILNNKIEPFEFVRKVSMLMSQVPQTELLIGMQEFIDDEYGFLKKISEYSSYPIDLFDKTKNGLNEFQIKNEAMFELYGEGGISFNKKEDEIKFLNEYENWKKITKK